MPEGALPLLLRGEAELLFLGTEPGVVASRGCASATMLLPSASPWGRGMPPAACYI